MLPINRNRLSRVLVVASDQAYQAGRPVSLPQRLKAGDALTYFDDTPQYSYRGQQPRPPQAFIADAGGFVVALPPIIRDDTGLKCVIYKNDLTKEIVVAFGGTDGTSSSGIQDWAENLKLGWNQWNQSRDDVLRDIQRTVGELNAPQDVLIHFTGQSLGGALAEYAAFEFSKQNPTFRSRTTLTTFNGLGAAAGLVQYGGASLIEVDSFSGLASIAHYYVKNDIVSRLGGINVSGDPQAPEYVVHIGGAATEYELNFVSDKTNPETGSKYLLTPVDAHRIESGFYLPFQKQADAGNTQFFSQAQVKPIVGIEAQSLQSQAATLLALFNDKNATTEESARHRLFSGLIFALGGASDSEVKTLATPVVDAMVASGEIGAELGAYLNTAGMKFATTYIDQYRRSAADYLVTAMVLEYLKNEGVPSGTQLESVRTVLQSAGARAASSMGVDPSVYSDDKAKLVRRAALNLQLIKINDPSNGPLLAAIGLTPAQIEQLKSLGTGATPQKDFVKSKLAFLLDLVKEQSNGTPGATEALTHTVAEISRQVENWLSDSRLVQGEVQRLQNNEMVAQATLEFWKGFGASIANAYGEFTAKIGQALDYGSALSRPALEGVVKAFKDVITAYNKSKTKPVGSFFDALEIAQDEVQGAAQTVVIAQGHPKNPFGISGYDPDSAPLPGVVLDEGASKFLTVFLPYAAAEGGQHIKLKLDGPNNQYFRVVAGDEVPVVNGAFELTIAEGQREIAFVLIQSGDVDVDSALTLSATLVDSQGNPTHQTHVEVNLALDANDEAAQTPTTRDIFGDRAPVDFDPYHSGVQAGTDALGNVITNPAQPEPDRADALYDSAGNDHIIAGGGNDFIHGDRGGDDQFDAGAGQDFASGGAGNDQIEGGADADVLTGGVGDDQLFGNVKGVVATLIVNGATESPTGVRGDFLSGESGNDVLVAGAGYDVLSGGGGEDTIAGGGGDDLLFGDTEIIAQGFDWTVTESTEGTATMFLVSPATRSEPVDSGSDLLYGGAGNDVIFAGDGDDTAFGEAGNDRAWGEAGSDTMLGGDGDDVLSGDNGVELLAAGLHGDDFLDGGSGNDLLNGDGGNDTLYGGAGNDQLYGDSTGVVGGDDYLDGEDGNDILTGAGGADTLFGGIGNDNLYGDADNTPLSEQGNDALYGEDGNDSLKGYAGDDELSGGAGWDQLYGDAGNDQLDGGADADTLDGGDGDDFLDGGDGDDIAVGGTGTDTILGGDGADRLNGNAGDDYLDGENGADWVLGETGNDHLFGGAGNDSIDAGDGNDYVDGGDGDDYINAGNGDNVLIGGTGLDGLYGGTGNDLYIIGADDISEGGWETIIDRGGINSLQLEIAPSSVSVESLGASSVELNLGGDRYLTINFLSGGLFSAAQFGVNEPIDLFRYASDHYDTLVLLTTPASTTRATLIGGKSNDELFANGKQPSFYGGKGDDLFRANDWQYLSSSPGGATVHLDLGDGHDRFEASVNPATRSIRNANVIEFGPGITADSVHLAQGKEGSLSVQYGTRGDSIDLFSPQPDSAFIPIDAVRFSNGSTISWEELIRPGVDIDWSHLPDRGPPSIYTTLGATQIDDRIIGSNYADSIFAHDGNDVIDGGPGEDLLVGENGNDTYLFGRGDGQDRIENMLRGASDIEVLRFKAGVDPVDVTFMRYNDDLIAQITGTLDRVTFGAFFTTSARVEFTNGTVYTPPQIPLTSNAALATEYADELFGTPAAEIFNALGGQDVVKAGGGDDTINGGAGNDTISGEAGNDILTGGPGRDLLIGGEGNDTYVLGPGEGYAEVSDASGANSVSIKAGLNPANIKLTRTSSLPGGLFIGDSLVVQIGDSADQMWIPNYFVGSNTIANIRFADGTVWDQAWIALPSHYTDLRGSGNALTGTTSTNVFLVDHVTDSISDPSSTDSDTLSSTVGSEAWNSRDLKSRPH